MRGSRCLLLLLVVNVAFLARVGASERAIALKDADFESRTKCAEQNNEGDWFVLFHMPWCGFCKEMIPIWERLADELKGELNVAKVDLEENPKVAHRFRRKVKGYPTMMIFSDGKLHTYTGGRDINHLKDFARGGFRKVEKDAMGPIPLSSESMTPVQRMIDFGHEFLEGVIDGYAGIWRNHQAEFLAAMSTVFSLGALFGFTLKIFIDAMLPPLPPGARRKKKVQ